MPPFRNLHVIINPGAHDEAVRADAPEADAIQQVLDAAGVPWTRHEVSEACGPQALARAAAEAGADCVVAAGGDGTVAGVAAGLLDTDVPMAIVPRGTANVFAAEMNVPSAAEAALALVTGTAPSRLRTVDVGDGPGDAVFLLRLAVGLEAAMVALTPDTEKAKWGRLAYVRTFWREARQGRRVRYRIEVDGQVHRIWGLTCMICNSANVGLRGLDVLPEVRVDDGLLHVVVLRSLSFRSFLGLAWRTLRGLVTAQADLAAHPEVRIWSGTTVAVTASPSQVIACDGEPLPPAFPVRARVHPGALRVVVPDQPAGA